MRRTTDPSAVLLEGLALVPDALADVAGHRRLERDLHRLRLAAGDAEGAARVLGDVEVGRDLEGVVPDLDLLDALDGEGAHLVVLLGPRVEVQAAVVVHEPVGIDGVGLGPLAVEGEVRDRRRRWWSTASMSGAMMSCFSE